jgi:hypothetical protein
MVNPKEHFERELKSNIGPGIGKSGHLFIGLLFIYLT